MCADCDAKIKTMLDFEEVDDDFAEALLGLLSDIPEIDLKVSLDGKRHGVITWEEWSPDQFNEFCDTVWETAITIAQTIIAKNIKYNNAYWWVRKACLEKYGDSGIPYFVHTFEKTMRSGCDDEDQKIDKLGYELLEYVCQKLEEKWDTEAEEEDGGDLDIPQEDPELPIEDPDMPLDEFEEPEAPVINWQKTCVYCGEPLPGRRRKYCSQRCREDFRKAATKDALRKAAAEESLRKCVPE